MRGIEQIPWLYDAGMALLERGTLGRWRRKVVGEVRGRTLEVGCGTGRNLPLYDPSVKVVATDPDPRLLRKARTRSSAARLVAARAEALPFRAGAFDAVVSTLVFCTVDDPERGLAEIRRVLDPPGTLHMLEHVRSENRLLAWIQDRIQPLWTLLAGGCRPNRETVALVESLGFRPDPASLSRRGTLRRFVARPGSPPPGSRKEIREYYRTVGRFIEMELAGRKDEEYWRARAREMDRPWVLELGAGTGRVTRHLAPFAERVVAVDLSWRMLARAQEALEGVPGVHLVQADMRSLRLNRMFDLIVAANDPFVHLAGDEERDEVLRIVADHLRPGGRFILDSHWLRPPARRKATTPEGWSRERTVGDPEDGVTAHETWKLDPRTWTGSVRYEYRQGGRTVGRARFHPRLWSPDEMEERFSRAGLRLRALLGDYRGTEWNPETASCLLAEAVREEETG